MTQFESRHRRDNIRSNQYRLYKFRIRGIARLSDPIYESTESLLPEYDTQILQAILSTTNIVAQT
jgi:hypothetical protein